ncbi:MAG: 30S ribosomal protein S8 [Bryobacterales bacterium]|jgi:small subunit ribosomal protein S8|nr:30S ribosomal protein S8 [Bryobacterales bacterium]MDE0296212.1 30S ribosomal protein S8 [Bryobacterales bacterium]MDE0436555.1 30S ribosomal protein S8 [Bryobacterales bacterium]
MQIDPVSDMLTRIRNAMAARHSKVEIPASKLKIEIVRILKEEGYIANYRIAEEGSKTTIKAYLKYGSDTRPVISRIERVSKPGRRVFVGSKEVPRVIGGMGVNILSTSSGVMTGAQARKKGVGGEIVCSIY